MLSSTILTMDTTDQPSDGKDVSPYESARIASNRSTSVSVCTEGEAREGEGGSGDGDTRAEIGRGEGDQSSRSSSPPVPSPSLPAPPIIRKEDSAIVIAADRGDLVEVMRLYKEDNVSLDTSYVGQTALIRASNRGHFPIVQFLVRNGAGLDKRDFQHGRGFTALHHAAFCGREKILRCLIGAGCDLNIVSHTNSTALMLAVEYDRRRCVARLLMEGADDSMVDNDGRTAFDIAVSNNRPYGIIDAWEGMKAKVSESDIMMALRCALAARNAPPVERPTTLLQNFFQRLSIAETSKIMMQIVSLWSGWDPASGADYDADMDPRFIDRDSAEYVQFGKGLLSGFSSIVDVSGRKDKSVDFFLPFVNAGGSKAFSRERAVSMMKVLAKDGERYEFGRDVEEGENPLRLILRNLTCSEVSGLISLQ